MSGNKFDHSHSQEEEFHYTKIRMGDDKFPGETEGNTRSSIDEKQGDNMNEETLVEATTLHHYFVKMGELQNTLSLELEAIRGKDSEIERSLYLIRTYENFLKEVGQNLEDLFLYAQGFQDEPTDFVDISGLENASNLTKFVFVLNKMAPTIKEAKIEKGTYKEQLLAIIDTKEFEKNLQTVGANKNEITPNQIKNALSVVNRDFNGEIKIRKG